jgi:hypothetical protein
VSVVQSTRGRSVAYPGAAGGYFTNVFAGGNNIKGGWTTVCAATPFTADSYTLTLASGGSGFILTDLGIGPAGQERVVLANAIFKTSNDGAGSARLLDVPYPIPAGTRVSARQQNEVANRDINVGLILRSNRSLGSPRAAMARVTTYGAVAAGASRGTQVDPGTVANTKGTWVEFSASLPVPVRNLLLTVVAVNTPYATYWFDIGTGPAGAEVVRANDLPFVGANGCNAVRGVPHWVDVSIPAGARLVVRGASEFNGADANRLISAVLHCAG